MMKLIVKAACAAASLATAFVLCSNSAPLSARTSIVHTASPVLIAGATYSWAGYNAAMIEGADPAIANPIAGARLRSAIEIALLDKGFLRVATPATADLVVSYHVALKREQDTKVYVRGGRICGWRGCIRGVGDVAVSQDNYTAGLLVLDLVDRRTGQLVWRATSDKRVDATDVTQAKLNALLLSMTKSLPST